MPGENLDIRVWESIHLNITWLDIYIAIFLPLLQSFSWMVTPEWSPQHRLNIVQTRNHELPTIVVYLFFDLLLFSLSPSCVCFTSVSSLLFL